MFQGIQPNYGGSSSIASIATGTVVGSDTLTYNYLKVVLSSAPTASDKVLFSMAAPSVVNGVISNLNVVIDYYPTSQCVNGALTTF